MFGHYCSTGGFWVPNIDKLQALISKTDKELGGMSCLSQYRLLNFYQEYISAFAKLVEPLRRLMRQDALLWTHLAMESMQEVARRFLDTPK